MEETSTVTEQHTSESVNGVTKLHKEKKQMKFEMARSESSAQPASIPAIEITFKNNDLAKKYKTSIEKFLYSLLTEEEKKSLSFRILEENVENTENQLPESLFCIDTTSTNEESAAATSDVPYYSTVYQEILVPANGNDVSFDGEPEESTPSIHVKTCFNCLGNHHMKECPEKYNKQRIARNRKNFVMSLPSSNTRYHEDDEHGKKPGSGQPGEISPTLREALGLKWYQLPNYVYHMRVLGYPPGWLQEAIVESSGLNVYDSVGEVMASKDTEKAANGETQYDTDKFIKYPGFNCSVPEGIIDEWRVLQMPPPQPHQQLSEAVRICGKPSPVESVRKRRTGNNSNSETKKAKNGDSESSQNEDSRGGPETPISSPAVTDDSVDAYGGFENSFDKNSSQTPNGVTATKTPRSSGSLSSTPGAAILDRGNPFTKLPDLTKFSKGITEHLPYENLPGAVGTFEKMRNILSCVRQKLTYDDE